MLMVLMTNPAGAAALGSAGGSAGYSIGALIIRIEFWGLLYYKYNKESPIPILHALNRAFDLRPC